MSLTSYIKENRNNDYINNVIESTQNNVRIINEVQLLVEHGSDIDNLLYKTKLYFNNYINNRINESYDDHLSLSEQKTARDLLIYCAEDYKEKLLKECAIYEGLLNGTMLITEAEFKLGKAVNDLWSQGKEKVVKIYKGAKTKIKELNELISAFVKKTFETLSEFANKIIEFIDKVGSSLLNIASKIGFGEDTVANLSDSLIDDIKSNPDKILHNKVYETLSNEINEFMINEGIVDYWNNSKLGKWYNSKKEKPVWNAFFQFANWLLVCKVLPMVVLAVFPGSLFYYIVSIAIKAIWNFKKFNKLIKQTKDYVHSWNTMTHWQRIWKGAVLFIMWYLWVQNAISIMGNSGKVLDAIKKSWNNGEFWKQLFGKAHTGIEPDKLEAMGAAVIRWVGKGFEGSISDAYNEIMDACKESVGPSVFEKLKDAVDKTKEAASELSKKINAATEENVKNITDAAKNFKGTSSTKLWDAISKFTQGDNWKDLDSDKVYKIVVSGTATDQAKWVQAAMKQSPEKFEKLGSIINKSVNSVHSNSGSASVITMTGAMIKDLKSSGLSIGAGPDGGQWGVIGEIASDIATDSGAGDIVPQVASFTAAMASDAPIITFKQKGDGFLVRLGDKKSKNYIYEVKNDGVSFIKPDKINNDKVQKAYDTIKKQLTEEKDKFVKKIQEADLAPAEKKKITDRIEEFNDKYSDNLKRIPLVVITGERISKEDQDKYDGKTNESYISLHDYMIMEGVTFDNLAEEISKIYGWIKKQAGPYGLEGKKGSGQSKKLKDWDEKRIHFYVDAMEKIFSGDAAANKDIKMLSKKSNEGSDKQYPITAIELISRFYYNVVWDKEFSKKTGIYEDIYNLFFYINDLVGALKDKKKNAENSDALNKNDIDNYCKAEYNKIIDLLEKIDTFFESSKISKELKLRKKFKITDNDKEDFVKKTNEKKPAAPSKDELENKIKQDKNLTKDEKEELTKEIIAITPNKAKDDEDTSTGGRIEGSDEQNNTDESDENNPNKSDENKPNDTQNTTDTSDDTGSQPVLIFSHMYGMDIAKANEKGPRKEMYSIKGVFHSLEFFEIKKGMNKYDIQEMLGDWMYTMAEDLCAITPILPFEKKKHWWKDKFIPNKNLKENEERRDFGNLTNGELAEIMNKKEKAKDYVLIKTDNISIAETDDEKKFVDDKKQEYENKLQNPDDKVKNLIKEIDPSAIDKDGNINKEKIKKIAKLAAEYRLSQKKSKKNKSKSIWQRIKNFVKSIFGGSKEEGERYNSLLKYIDDEVSESINEYDTFLDDVFSQSSLSQYIAEHRNV